MLGLACACKDVIVIETFDPELRRPALIMLRCQTYEELEKSHNAFVAACAVKPEVTAVQLRSMLPAFSADEYSRIRGLDENLAASELLSYPRWAEATDPPSPVQRLLVWSLPPSSPGPAYFPRRAFPRRAFVAASSRRPSARIGWTSSLQVETMRGRCGSSGH